MACLGIFYPPRCESEARSALSRLTFRAEPASERLSLDVKVQLDCHKDVDWPVSDMPGRKSPLPNGRDRFLVEPAWVE
jgi:hypothetical protein